MPKLTLYNNKKTEFILPQNLLNKKRQLTNEEIEILKANSNYHEDNNWELIYIDKEAFNPELIKNTRFAGFIILGKLEKGTLKYNDLELEIGIYNSYIKNTVTGDYNTISNVSYLENYRLGSRVILFNIQEMACTNHSKFGNGIIKEGEKESDRISIAVGNENGGRSILPFEQMISADAYIWSKYRDDKELMNRLKEITESSHSKKLDTYGIVGDDAVIKNTTLIKDAKIGAFAYIKGAFKIKNVTILSTQTEAAQIGEGVELVNGIMGEGSHVFYQAVAVRFVLGKNCHLKYGARLINSVLGDNSTVSCCELLNNLVFPFHEQHHNSSFLIATTIMGQSNIAAGATIGSNHNSRSPDGEIIAGRGFWPGLCSDFKHNSKFAAFILAVKGSYQNELDIHYPFALISPSPNEEKAIHIIPAWWFMYDMFAIVRNRYKFSKRDKRKVKIQNIETEPLAPDTIEQIIKALKRIEKLTAKNLKNIAPELYSQELNEEELISTAKQHLLSQPEKDFSLIDSQAQKKYGAKIIKVAKSYNVYCKILVYFAVRSILEYCTQNSICLLKKTHIDEIKQLPLYTQWINAGGQLIPIEKIKELTENIKSKKINSWQEVHKFYDKVQEQYISSKAAMGMYVLEYLYQIPIENFDKNIYQTIIKTAHYVANAMYEKSVSSREKDFTDYYRAMTFSSQEEMKTVLGSINDSDFLEELKKDTEDFNKKLDSIFLECLS